MILSNFYSNLTWYEIYSNIFDKKYNGYFIVDDFRLNINQNWIPSITKKTIELNFLGLKCMVFSEYNVFLNRRYGIGWKEGKIKKLPKALSFHWVQLYANSLINNQKDSNIE